MRGLLIAAMFLIGSVEWSVAQNAKYVGSIPVQNVDLLNRFEHDRPANPRRKFSILASTYSSQRGSYDPTVSLIYPGEQIAANFSAYRGTNVFNFLYWPKEVRQVPRSVLGHDAIVHLDGATTFGKTDGSVHVSDVSDFNFPATYGLISKLLPFPDSYMFHSGVWFEVDGDSRDDLVTCRLEIENGMVRWAQLVWLEQPRDGIKGRWPVKVLKESACDTNLAYVHMRNGIFNQDDLVFTTGFHTRKLAYFWSDGRNWHNPDKTEGRIIEQGRQYYDVSVADINYDGEPDLLVTVVSAEGGSVEVWEIPKDYKNPANFRRHVIGTGFNSRNGGANGRSPKTARTFHPTGTTNRKPWIYVAGGDDGRAYFLMPLTGVPGDWTYQRVTVADYGPNVEVSGMVSADIEGDGYEEFFVSVHDLNRIDVYTFKP